METRTLVSNMSILKSMAKQKLIELHAQTGKKVYWAGEYFKTYYVFDGKSQFEYKGNTYVTEYRDGCFYPFVYKLENTKQP